MSWNDINGIPDIVEKSDQEKNGLGEEYEVVSQKLEYQSYADISWVRLLHIYIWFYTHITL